MMLTSLLISIYKILGGLMINEFYDFIVQSIKYKDVFNLQSIMADGVYQRGTELTNTTKLESIYPLMSSDLFNIIELIDSYKKRGILVNMIEYSITNKPDNPGSPDIGGVLLLNKSVGEADISILSISKTTKNPLTINKCLDNNLSELIKDMGIIAKIDSEEVTSDLIEYYADKNFIDINEINNKFVDTGNWKKKCDGLISFKLDKLLLCEKECVHSNYHNKAISSLSLNKPWELNGELKCEQCDSRMIITPPIPIFEYSNEKPVYTNVSLKIDDEIKSLIVNSVDLGAKVGVITRLTLLRELGIKNNVDGLLIMPKNMYFSMGSNDYKISFDSLNNNRFKRSFARGINNNLKIRLFEKGL